MTDSAINTTEPLPNYNEQILLSDGGKMTINKSGNTYRISVFRRGMDVASTSRVLKEQEHMDLSYIDFDEFKRDLESLETSEEAVEFIKGFL